MPPPRQGRPVSRNGASWLIFLRYYMSRGFDVRIHEAASGTKYLYVIHPATTKTFCVRFGGHAFSGMSAVDFDVCGPKGTGITQAIQVTNWFFRLPETLEYTAPAQPETPSRCPHCGGCLKMDHVQICGEAPPGKIFH